MPVYAMSWNVRRNQMILGLNAALRVYTLTDPGFILEFLQMLKAISHFVHVLLEFPP